MTKKQDTAALRAPLGMVDILPEDSARWQEMETNARSVFSRYGYREIRTPIMEFLSLFARGIGDATDIVEKEMFVLAGGDETPLAMRPEATASAARAYVQHNFPQKRKFQKFFYIGPMFRKERPQAGRLRQFHQIGVEAFGAPSPLLDAETILLAAEALRAIGLDGFTIKLNSIGCPNCRPRYRQELTGELQTRIDEMCPDCRRRAGRNIFRVLDCKQEQCREIISDLPVIRDYLDDECREHFAAVSEALDQEDLPYRIEDRLVRGLDYYTRTVYEICHAALGARDAVCGGGRYDGLVEEVGGPATPGVGFAIGMEAALLAISKSRETEDTPANEIDVYVTTIQREDRPVALKVCQALRHAGLRADMDYELKSLKAQMRAASRLGAPWAMILGPDEIAQNAVTLRNMEHSVEERLTLYEAIGKITENT